MCDRHGNLGLRNPATAALDRRSFLKASALGTITMAVGGGMMGLPGSARAATTIKGTHGNGFCNAAFFITHARQLAKEDGLTLEFVNTPSFADQVTFLGTGQVDVSVLPYTNFMALYDAGVPVKIVGGGGVQGVFIVAQPGLDTPAKLKGKTLGTFQNDTLEVLPYDWLKKNGVSYKDVTVRYMDSMGDMVAAFKAGAIDIASTIEPYGSALLNDVKGSILLSDGVDIYGPEYTDCVLAASTKLLEEGPQERQVADQGDAEGAAAFRTESGAAAHGARWHLLQDLARERAHRRQGSAGEGRPESAAGFHLEPCRLDHCDGLHEEEAWPRCDRLELSRAGYR